MRSEKGITLVALIGIFVLLVILAGISISIASKGNNEEQAPIDNVTTIEDEMEDYEEEELVVDPLATTTPAENETVTTENVVENTAVEDVTNTAVEDTTNTVASNEVE